MAKATNIISKKDKELICKTAEDWLRGNPGRTRLSHVLVCMKKECHRFVEINTRYKKEGYNIYWEIVDILRKWQQNNSSKIGCEEIAGDTKTHKWFWYGDSTKRPQPSSRENKKANSAETRFYAPFAKWLEEKKECTKAIATGGKVSGTKWSNPDVVGVKESSGLGGATNYELVSAEIKTSTNTGEITTGFGQACAYKLFSHKSYLVVPTDSDGDELQRIKELCEQYDIGLVVFDKKKPANPAFELRCSAKTHGKPNPSYVNNSIKELLKKDGYNIFDLDSTPAAETRRRNDADVR